ncbi:MAG TPA: radical SAM protein [Terracidiphilus sp.]|nr:radical SAM protein [Terracidiphilus sp.]
MECAGSTLDVTVLSTTESVCPVCLRQIGAERIAIGDQVFLRKECPEHGRFQTVLWRGLDSYLAWKGPQKPLHQPTANALPVSSKGCPHDCGPCTDHHQQTCCAIVEVTPRCNLACPVCFADASAGRAGEPDANEIVERCRALLATRGPFNIQLSGGEPTVRNDLPELIARLREAGAPFVQLNSNGIRLACEAGYARRLKWAGLDCVFLQFDGLTADVYKAIRGCDLFRLKAAAIANCAEVQLGVVLVPTLVPGVNTGQIGAILRFALEHMPVVRAVHFQPVSYFGRYPGSRRGENGPGAGPQDSDRITIPEVLEAIEQQTGGLMRAGDFHAPSAENAYCSFQGKFHVAANGQVKPAAAPKTASCCGTTQQLVQPGGSPQQQSDGGELRRARQAVSRQWAFPVIQDAGRESSCCSATEFASFDAFLAAEARALSVSSMAFQDAWNLDLDRLRECFLHVATTDGRMVPVCAYNLTSCDGQTLYRPLNGDPR